MVAICSLKAVLLDAAEVLAHVDILILFRGKVEKVGISGLDTGQPVALARHLKVGRLASLLDR
jgi:hypothetical protein